MHDFWPKIGQDPEVQTEDYGARNDAKKGGVTRTSDGNINLRKFTYCPTRFGVDRSPMMMKRTRILRRITLLFAL